MEARCELLTMKEEHVVNHAKANNLRRRDEQTLEASSNDERYPGWCFGREQRHEEAEKHAPPDDWHASDPTSKRDRKDTANSKHEDVPG
jgi:hypothetical protein